MNIYPRALQAPQRFIALAVLLLLAGCSTDSEAVLELNKECRNGGQIVLGDDVWLVRADLPLEWEPLAVSPGEIEGVLSHNSRNGKFKSDADGREAKMTLGEVELSCTVWNE